MTIGQEQRSLDTVFSIWKPGVSSNHIYSWSFLNRPSTRRQLVWTQDGHAFKVTISRLSSAISLNLIIPPLLFRQCKQGTMNQSIGDTIAIFRTNHLAAPLDGRRRRPPTIEIWPEAYNNPTMLKHVIMSALVLERKRLSS